MKRRRLMGKLFAYIVYSITNVNKKYGNSSFVNPLSMSGDGTVTYTSSNTAVATIDNNGNVTIVAPGEATITATVEDTLDFEYENNSASYTLIVAKADGNVSEPPTPKTIVYDGDDHQLINAGIGTGTMLYKFDYDEEWDEIIPIASESGTYTILYKSSENQYYTESSIGTVDVTIQKALSQYTAPTPVSPLVYNTNAQNLLNEGSTNDGLIWYSTDEINWSTNIPQGTNAGEYEVYWKLVGDYNHTDISPTLITVKMDKVTPTVTPPCEGLVIPYDGETHELIQCGSTDYGTLKYSLDGVTYSTSIPTASAMDDYIIYWMVEGDSNVNDIEPDTVQASISGIIVLNPTINLEYNLIDYDGTAKQPSVEVLDDDGNIILSSEYTITYSDNVDAGTATVTITDITGGTYIINGTKTFTINSVDPTYTAPTAKTGLVYNGDSQLLLNSGSVTGGTMYYSSDEVTWSENNNHSETNAGTYDTYWKIIGDNNHNNIDSTLILVTINKASISPVVTMSGWTYEGTPTSPSISGNPGNGTVTYYYKVNSADDSTYTETKPGSTSIATTYKVKAVISETDNYLGATVYTTFNISKAPGRVTISGRTLTYNGNSQDLVTVSGATGTMYYRVGTSGEWNTNIPTITNKTSSSNTDSWTIYYYIDASTNYNECGNSSTPCGSVTTTMEKITPTIIAPTAKSAQAYTGSALALLNPGSTNVGELLYSLDHVNWSTSIPTAINNGTYLGYYRVEGNNNVYSMPKESPYYYTVSSTSSIVEKTVTATVIPEYNSTVYDKTAKTPSVTVKDGNTVIPSSEYTVSYSNNINAGTATITITDKSGGNYAVTGSVTFTITLKEVCLTWGTLSWTYDGSAHSTTCTVECLISGDSCSATLSGNSITNKGTTTVTATGLSNNNYKLPSSKTNTLTISARPINVTAGSNSKTYDGSALTYNSATAEGTGTNRGLVSGHSMTSCTVTGTITNKGSVNNVPSGAVIKSGSTDVTSNYSISYVNGTLTINARAVTYRANDETWTYDGNTHSASNTATLTSGSLVSGHSATFSCSGSVGAGVGSATKTLLSVTIKSGSTDVSGNYSITRNNGTLKINAKSISIPTPTNYSGAYNGSAHTATFGSATGASITKYRYSTNNSSWTESTSNPSLTNVGTLYTLAYYTASTNYTGSNWSSSATITISRAKTASASAANKTYNGTTESNGTAQTGVSGSYVSWSGVTSATNAGSYRAYATPDSNHAWSDGTTGQKTIDWTMSCRGLTAPVLNGASTTFHNTATASVKTAGTVSGGTATAPGTLTWSNLSRTALGSLTASAYYAATTNFCASSAGTATVTITCANDLSVSVTRTNRTWNGSSQVIASIASYHGCTPYLGTGSSSAVSSWANANTSISATNVGTYYIWKKGTKDGNHCNDVGSTYDGSVVINCNNDYIIVAPTANTLTYNGAALNLLSGGSARTRSGTNIPGSFSYGTGTWVGSNLTGNWTFTPSNSGYCTKTGSVSGAKINARAITVTGNSASYTYNGSGRSVSGGSITSGSLGTGDTITITASGASGTNAGSYTNSITSVVIKKGSTDVTNQYSITKANGSLSIGKANGLITCPTANTLTYNGLAEYLVSSGSSSTGTVYYDMGTGIYSTSRPSAINPGAYIVRAYAAESTNYTESSICIKTVTISKYTPIVTLSATDRAYNGSALYATATVSKPTNGKAIAGTIYYGTSSGATTYSVTYSGSSVNLSSVSVTNAGSVTVYAYFVPNSTCNDVYNESAKNASKTMTVSRTNCSGPTVSGRTVAYNRSALALATVSGNCGTMHYRLGTSGSWTTSISTATDIGAYTVYWYMDASTNYNGKGSSSSPAGSVTGNITTNYINLGLPSGTLWSYTNIGSANEGSYGNYYMYGLKTTFSSGATPYSGMENPLSTSQDAAYNYSNDNYSFGSNWRTPTAGQLQELMIKCTITEVTANGLNCYKFTGPNGNYIIIPRAGSYTNGTLVNTGNLLTLCSSTPSPDVGGNKAFHINYSSSTNAYGVGAKDLGLSLRPVYFNSNTRALNFVDLGLPSGTLWADKNIGAGKATDAGTFFKYGVTSAYQTSLTPYSGTASIIGTSRDQARAIWGGTWHLPTSDLITELFNNTTLSIVTYSGVKCLRCACKTKSTRYIVLPLVGYYYGNTGGMTEVGNQMRFWSGTPYDSTHVNIGVAYVTGGGVITEGASGLSVRAVL